MEEAAATPAGLSRLDIGVVIVLVAMGFAGVVGLIAVFDAGSDVTAFGTGFGAALLIFQAGATIACALACLARHRFEALSIGALVTAGLSVDLFLLAIWLGIDDETYGKVLGIAFVWAFFALLILGLALAAQPRDSLARSLYLGAIGASLLAGILASVLILSVGDTASRRGRSDRYHVHRRRESAPTSRRSARRARLSVVRGSRDQPRR